MRLRAGHSPQVPLAAGNDVDAQQQIRDRVRGDAVPDVFGADHEPGDEAEPDAGGQFFRVIEHGKECAERRTASSLGRVAILLAPTDEDDLDRLMLSRSPRFQALLDNSRGSIAAGKGLSRDEFWKKVRHRRRGKK